MVFRLTTVSLRVLAPLTNPPVVPEMLVPIFGLRTLPPASTSIAPALMMALLPMFAFTGVLTEFHTLAPAPASRPPLTASTRPLVWEVDTELTLKSPPIVNCEY